MIVLDTPFLVAFFNEQDKHHQQALTDMNKVEGELQVMSDYVVLETATVLRVKASLSTASIFLDGIREKNNLQFHYFDIEDFENIANIFKKQRNELSFIDASVVYLSLITGSAIATYDSELLKEEKRIKSIKK